jgi:hypothetical protein
LLVWGQDLKTFGEVAHTLSQGRRGPVLVRRRRFWGPLTRGTLPFHGGKLEHKYAAKGHHGGRETGEGRADKGSLSSLSPPLKEGSWAESGRLTRPVGEIIIDFLSNFRLFSVGSTVHRDFINNLFGCLLGREGARPSLRFGGNLLSSLREQNSGGSERKMRVL